VAITLEWSDCCPTCERELRAGGEAAYDPDVRAVFCFKCARNYLIRKA
jgi:hypothetical protein